MGDSISLHFDRYWRKPDISGIPNTSGIYVVYESTYNQQSNTVDLSKVIYIGESAKVRDRIISHEKWSEWRKQCSYNSEPCFSFTSIVNPDRERGEAALIYRHKPPVNAEYKHSFPYPKTTMMLSGRYTLLTKAFTVEGNEGKSLLSSLYR